MNSGQANPFTRPKSPELQQLEAATPKGHWRNVNTPEHNEHYDVEQDNLTAGQAVVRDLT